MHTHYVLSSYLGSDNMFVVVVEFYERLITMILIRFSPDHFPSYIQACGRIDSPSLATNITADPP